MAYKIILPKKQEPKSEDEEFYSLKEDIRDLREVFEEVPTSDFQGIVEVKSKEIVYKLNLPPERQNEVEDILIQYGLGDLDINSAQRFILSVKD